MKRLSVGIIGGGIGGLTTAVALHRAGIDVSLYERSPVLREIGAGMMLWSNGARVMKILGLLPAIVPESGETSFFDVRRRDGRVLMKIPLTAPDVPSLCIPRAKLLEILAAQLDPATIKTQHEFSSFTQDTDGVSVFFQNGAEGRHDVLVGADGIRSQVRCKMFGEQPPRYRGYTIWRGIGTDRHGVMDPLSSSESWGSGQRFGILNTGAGRYTWYAAVSRPAGLPDPVEGRRAELLRMFGNWHAPIPDLIASTPEDKIMKNGGRDLVPLRKWVKGRIVLLGDSAHATTPNLGQGGGMAIEDAFVLAELLSRKAPREALTDYELRRFARTRMIQRRSRLLGFIGQMRHPVLSHGRDLITQILPASIFAHNLQRTLNAPL